MHREQASQLYRGRQGAECVPEEAKSATMSFGTFTDDHR
jgi:hypothetical protein